MFAFAFLKFVLEAHGYLAAAPLKSVYHTEFGKWFSIDYSWPVRFALTRSPYDGYALSYPPFSFFLFFVLGSISDSHILLYAGILPVLCVFLWRQLSFMETHDRIVRGPRVCLFHQSNPGVIPRWQ